MAAQLTATKGPLARAESSWRVRATSSLPVPVSPWMRTGAGVAAACSMSVDLLHGRAPSDEAAEAPHVLHAAPQDRDLVERPAALEPLLDQQPQPVEVHRLGQVVVGTLPHRAHRGVDGGPAGQDDDRHAGHLLLQRGQQAEAVHVRHHEIGHHERWAQAGRLLQRLAPIGGHVGRVAPGPENRLERGPRVLLVVHDQNGRFR
jgi:hypothetical protein